MSDLKRILVKFPSRERPEQFAATLKGWAEKCHFPERVQWHFSLDLDDPTLPNYHIDLAPYVACVHVDKSTSKIHAVNRDIDHIEEPWDILMVLSDDMQCVRDGWDVAIERDMDSDDMLLWYFDGKQKDICTLPIMTRKYYDRFGYVYNPAYLSVFADDEQTAIAKREGKLKFVDDPIAMHMHPANYGHIKPDGLYRKNETRKIWDKDRHTFNRRMARGFPHV